LITAEVVSGIGKLPLELEHRPRELLQVGSKQSAFKLFSSPMNIRIR